MLTTLPPAPSVLSRASSAADPPGQHDGEAAQCCGARLPISASVARDVGGGRPVQQIGRRSRR